MRECTSASTPPGDRRGGAYLGWARGAVGPQDLQSSRNFATRETAAGATMNSVHLNGSSATRHNALHARTVVCSPHFDDAVLSCWALLDRDPDCAVINVFTGAPRAGFTSWYDQMNGASSSVAHMHQRAIEDRNALSVAGKTPVDLGMLEVQYRLRQNEWLHTLFRCLPPLRFAVLRAPVLHSALSTTPAPSAEDIADAIAKAAPNATTVCVPAGIGAHTDHRLVRQAGAVLASRGLHVRLYADMPYAVRYGWPGWIGHAHKQRANDRTSSFWRREIEGLVPGDVIEKATVVGLSREECARKLAAIRRYTTQIDSLSTGRLRHWMRESALGYEVYWELQDVASTRAAC